ncbi:AbiH family protein [Acinetobacter seifertii]|uniref:AbiH family protein n=1 Tax=Acinetobacter seifertii TaxID=1530123 RepID=UPI00386263E6
MNILIVGNGFDLSHYLPTKYDHFMVAMGAIENWDEQKGEMQFDDLFGSLYEKENYFFKYTKAMYQTDEIKISTEQVKELKQKLKENVWYQYFSDHIREVKTWIDFETKISEALKIVANFLVQIESTIYEFGSFSSEICFYGQKKQMQIFLTREYCNALELFKILESGYYIDQEDCDEYGNSFNIPINIGDPHAGDLRFFINNIYILLQSGFSKIKVDQILSELYKQLDKFIEIFNQYLELIVNQLSSLKTLQIGSDDWSYPDLIYSFNYTSTYARLYDSVKIEYLHGSHGEYQNIVLGVSDLEHENLKKLKAYGFTKYHQKLLKNTDYIFLSDASDVKNKIKLNKKNVMNRKNINFFIWGHSLDVSDEAYINELFDLNNDSDYFVRVKVFHFNNQAKFDLLTNLLHILGKEKVEKWMKNGWLNFEPNPNIIEINNIQPIDLPQFG